MSQIVIIWYKETYVLVDVSSKSSRPPENSKYWILKRHKSLVPQAVANDAGTFDA